MGFFMSWPVDDTGGDARRRAEQEGDEEMDGGLGDLAGILKPMIAAMIKEILQQLLGGEGLKGMITGLLLGRQSGTSAAGPSTATTSAKAKGRGKQDQGDGDDVARPGRWNERAGKGASIDGEDLPLCKVFSQRTPVRKVVPEVLLSEVNVGALIYRIGFWGFLIAVIV